MHNAGRKLKQIDMLLFHWSVISTNLCYVVIYLSPAGLGCTNIPLDYNAWATIVDGCSFVGGGTQWCNGYCTGLQIRQSGLEPLVGGITSCSWAGHLTLAVPLSNQLGTW